MDNYYDQEDQVPETADVQLANLEAQKPTLAAVNQYADETLKNIWEKVNTLWVEAGDRQDAATQNTLVATYEEAERLQKSLKANNLALETVLEAAETIGKQKQEIELELSDLTEAIYEGDTDHPLLNAFAESIETNVYEYAAEGFYEDAYVGATESIYDEFYSAIRKLSPGMSYFAIERFVGTLKGDHEMNDIQRGLLLSLLQTFVVEAKAS